MGIAKNIVVGSNQMELVEFFLNHMSKSGIEKQTYYGINVAKVLEIIPLPGKITKIPGGLPAQYGMILHREKTLPLINLAYFLDPKQQNIDVSEDMVILVSEFAQIRVGFIVHGAVRILRRSWADIVPVDIPIWGENKSRLIVGTLIVNEKESDGVEGQRAGDIILLLDVEAIAEALGFFGHIEAEEDRIQTEPDKGKVILLIDDSKTARNMVARLLTKTGYSVLEATNGQEGLLVAERARKIDLVVCDVEMPIMDGYSFTTAFKNKVAYKNVPVILHSSMSGENNIRRGLSSGASEYVVKFDPHNITEAVKKLL